VIFGLALMVLLLFAGLAIDSGSLYVNYGHLKRAVDSAAVAAANAYRGTKVFPVGTPMSTIMAENYGKIQGAAVETIALDGLQVDPTDLGNGKGIGTGITSVQVYICDSNGDGYRDGDTGDTSGKTLPADFYAACPATNPDPLLHAPQGRKLVYVEATLRAPLFFLTLFWPNGYFPLTTSTISEAAPLDLVIVIDSSGSMGKLTPGYNDYFNPTACNTNDTCEPLHSAKAAAETLINTLYQGYDRVSIITFDQYAKQITGDATHPFATVNDALAQFDVTQHRIILHYDTPRVSEWENWRAGNPGGKFAVDPMNPEDMDGDGKDEDDVTTGPVAAHPYAVSYCPGFDPAQPLDITNPDNQLMAYQERWWDNGWSQHNPYMDGSQPDAPPPPAWWAPNTNFGGAPCDSKLLFDSVNWLDQAQNFGSFDAVTNDTAIRNWLSDQTVNFDQNRNALSYYLSDATHTVAPGSITAASLLPNAAVEDHGYARSYHDVAGRLLSPVTTCTGCAIRTAFNDFNNDGRNDATWVMVFLSDGAANATDQPAQFPAFFTDTATGWDITADTASPPNHPQFANGFCEGYLGDGNLWSRYCAELNPPTSYTSGGTYTNTRYCIKENAYKDASGVVHAVNQCPPDYGHTSVVHLDSTQLHSLPNRMLYGPIQYAMDMVDMLALQKSSTGEKVAPFGDKKVGVYTIAFGDETAANADGSFNLKAATNSNGTDTIYGAEELLRYMASVGDDGDRTTNPCIDGVTGHPVASGHDCGNYYFAPDATRLVAVFADIAKRIQTRISY